jgi:hypothetical protein
VLEADRVYAFDGPWNDFPKNEIPKIKEIISPAKLPDNLFTMVERKRSEQDLIKSEPDSKIAVPTPNAVLESDQPIADIKPVSETLVTAKEQIEPEKPKATDEGGPQSESGPEDANGADGT